MPKPSEAIQHIIEQYVENACLVNARQAEQNMVGGAMTRPEFYTIQAILDWLDKKFEE